MDVTMESLALAVNNSETAEVHRGEELEEDEEGEGGDKVCNCPCEHRHPSQEEEPVSLSLEEIRDDVELIIDIYILFEKMRALLHGLLW